MADPNTDDKPSDSKAAAAKSLPTTTPDRVAMVSRKSDGTADQTPDYERVVSTETAIELDTKQLSEQAVSAVDEQERFPGGRDVDAVGDNEADPDVKELKSKHEAAEKAAAKVAEAEPHRIAAGVPEDASS